MTQKHVETFNCRHFDTKTNQIYLYPHTQFVDHDVDFALNVSEISMEAVALSMHRIEERIDVVFVAIA